MTTKKVPDQPGVIIRDPETLAMHFIVNKLVDFPEAARHRILAYVMDRFGPKATDPVDHALPHPDSDDPFA